MVKITNENLPRVVKCREKRNEKDEYFGPFVSTKRISVLLNFFKKNLKTKCCSKKFSLPFNHKPCLNYHINRCSAPCGSKISVKDYMKSIDIARNILKGDIKNVIKHLSGLMNEYSEKLLYEKAGLIRDQIKALEEVESTQLVELLDNQNNCDFIGLYTDFNNAALSIIQQRGGKIVGKENFMLNNILDYKTILTDFLKTYYLNITQCPDIIFIPEEIEENCSLTEAISQKLDKKVRIQKPDKLIDKNILRLSIENAEMFFQEKQIVIDKIHSLRELKISLNLKKLPRNIECFDVATLNGKYNTASVVSLLDGKPNKKEYRQFNIGGDEFLDDCTMIKEVVERRYQRILNENKKLPDLIVVDGGRGQVNAAKKILNLLNLEIPIIGLAKKNEEIFFPNKKKSLLLPKGSKSLRILQLARDEAHRFSNTRLRKRYLNDNIKTELLNIKGIGKKKANILLKRFRSLNNIKNASIEDLSSIKEIGSSLAKKIYSYLHK